jgi:thymidylate synthase (FAD)
MPKIEMPKIEIVKVNDDGMSVMGVKLDQNTLPPLDYRDEILDKGFVELLDMMPKEESPDMAVVTAARVSYASESKGEEKDKKLLHYLLKHRHTSPFEQVEFKFRVHAPLVTWWQWVRHRTFSFNFQSGRYTEFKEDAFYVPDVWRLQAKVNKQASEGEVAEDVNTMLTDTLLSFYDYGYRMYNLALSKGVAREQARLFLPGFSVYYTAIVKVDAHNLMHFLRLRIQKEAQYEIRVYAEAIWKMFKEKMPWTAEWLIENEPEVFS